MGWTGWRMCYWPRDVCLRLWCGFNGNDWHMLDGGVQCGRGGYTGVTALVKAADGCMAFGAFGPLLTSWINRSNRMLVTNHGRVGLGHHLGWSLGFNGWLKACFRLVYRPTH